MHTAQLARNGMILADTGSETTEPLSVLSGKVQLETGYTLRSFIEMLRRYPAYQAMSVFIPPLIEECEGCPGAGCTTDFITHLELVKRVEMVGYPGDPRFNFICTLVGRDADLEQELRRFQLDSLLDMPVSLGKLKHTVFGDSVSIMEFDTDFNLFEFIDGITWDFGFQRFPEHCSIRLG